MNEPLEEQTGGVTVSAKVYLGVVLTSSLLACDKSTIFPVGETPGGD